LEGGTLERRVQDQGKEKDKARVSKAQEKSRSKKYARKEVQELTKEEGRTKEKGA
jgi:hypothetical protein